MRHDLHAEGVRYRLRPVEPDDAAAIVEIRTDPGRGRYIHPTSPDVEHQRAWIEAYLDRPGDCYFMVERRTGGAPEGTLGIYDMAARPGTGECGRWVLRAGSMAAPESIRLLYRLAFLELGLERVVCRTVAENAAVVSFHRACGLAETGVLAAAFDFGGRRVDAVEQLLCRDAWPATDALLAARIDQLETLLAR